MTIWFPTLETRATATKDPGLCHCSKTCKKSTVHTCYKLSLCETGSFIIIATSPPLCGGVQGGGRGKGIPQVCCLRLDFNPNLLGLHTSQGEQGGGGRGEARKESVSIRGGSVCRHSERLTHSAVGPLSPSPPFVH